MDEQRKPWEQQPEESAAAYRRFCYYRDLGPGRTLERAYGAYLETKQKKAPKGTKKPVPGNWKKDAARFKWKDRAAAWDVAHLAAVGQDVVTTFISSVQRMAELVLQRLLSEKRGPRNWGEVVEAVNILGSFIPPETVEALQATAELGDPPAIGASRSE